MIVNWLIESDTFSDIDGLTNEITRQGHAFKILSDRNYWDRHWSTLFDPKDCVIYYGGLELGYMLRREAPWVPGVYTTLENYDCHYYYPRFGKYLLNQNYAIIPYGELERRMDWIYEHFGIDDTIFIRPDRGNKIFTGKAIYKERFIHELPLLGFYKLKPEELCIVCEPRNVRKEWRFLIVDGQIITGSEYRPDKVCVDVTSIHDDAQIAYRVAQEALRDNEYNPDRAWSLDICKTEAGNFYVLEVGCFSSAGLYAMDNARVVEAVSRVALEDWKEIYESV